MSVKEALAGLAAGLIGGMGLGGGGVLLLYLTVFAGVDQLTAQGINLLFFLPIAVVAIVVYALQKKIKWKTVLPMAGGGVLGAVFGSWLAGVIGTALLRKIFGVLLLFMGVKEIFGVIHLHRSEKCDTLKKE